MLDLAFLAIAILAVLVLAALWRLELKHERLRRRLMMEPVKPEKEG